MREPSARRSCREVVSFDSSGPSQGIWEPAAGAAAGCSGVASLLADGPSSAAQFTILASDTSFRVAHPELPVGLEVAKIRAGAEVQSYLCMAFVIAIAQGCVVRGPGAHLTAAVRSLQRPCISASGAPRTRARLGSG